MQVTQHTTRVPRRKDTSYDYLPVTPQSQSHSLRSLYDVWTSEDFCDVGASEKKNWKGWLGDRSSFWSGTGTRSIIGRCPADMCLQNLKVATGNRCAIGGHRTMIGRQSSDDRSMIGRSSADALKSYDDRSMTGRLSFDALTINHLSPEGSKELSNNVFLVFH